MKPGILLSLALALTPYLGFAPAAHAAEADIAKAEQEQAFALGLEAYVWSYPLVITAATAETATRTDKPKPNGHAPFNQIGHVGKLITAADKDVVSSNADTVYSSAFLDLKQGAALITVPDAGKRYYALMLEDAYTNVFGYIGTRVTGGKAGSVLITGPGWNGKPPKGVKVIQAPTPIVWVIGRTLVDNEMDFPNVKAFQQQIAIKIIPPALDSEPAKARWNLKTDPKLVPVDQVNSLNWSDYFYWAGQLMKDNPPLADDAALVEQFKTIGLSAKGGFSPETLSDAQKKGLAEGFEAGRRVVQRESLKSGGTVVNGWAFNLNQAKWGLDYNLRAAIALRSLGQNQAEEALYMNTRADSQGEALNGSKRYTVTFRKGELPPVDAFWSITMYNAQNFFVENPINRAAIGNRTPGMATNPDGSLTIYVQKDAPEGGKKANWLPAPEGNFRLSLRLYMPKSDVLTGKWTPPSVVAQ